MSRFSISNPLIFYKDSLNLHGEENESFSTITNNEISKKNLIAQSDGVVEYTNCTSAECPEGKEERKTSLTKKKK